MEEKVDFTDLLNSYVPTKSNQRLENRDRKNYEQYQVGYVYVIQCECCGFIYVGSTMSKLSVRLNNHISTVNQGKKCHTKFYKHFPKGAARNYMKIYKLDEYNNITDLDLRVLEHAWIQKLQTINFGFNMESPVRCQHITEDYCGCWFCGDSLEPPGSDLLKRQEILDHLINCASKQVDKLFDRSFSGADKIPYRKQSSGPNIKAKLIELENQQTPPQQQATSQPSLQQSPQINPSQLIPI